MCGFTHLRVNYALQLREEKIQKREGLLSTWNGCLNPKDVEYRAISFRYALALFCLIFARESDLGSYRSFRSLLKYALDASVATGLHRHRCSLAQCVFIFFRRGNCSLMLYTAHLKNSSHIQVTGLPKTALPQDVRRLVQTLNLENVLGSESVTFYCCLKV